MEIFQRFVRLCAGRTGQLLNLSSLAADCGVSHTTARQWISILQGRYGEALPVYVRVLAMEPGFAAGHNNIAIACARTGNIDQAIAHFREAIRIRPDYEDAIKNLKIAEKEKNREVAK